METTTVQQNLDTFYYRQVERLATELEETARRIRSLGNAKPVDRAGRASHVRDASTLIHAYMSSLSPVGAIIATLVEAANEAQRNADRDRTDD